MSAFQDWKLQLMELTALSKDALHIYIGLACFLSVALLARRGLAAPQAWWAVLALACLGEWLDLRSINGPWAPEIYWASLHDLINTLFWPTVLYLLATLQGRRLGLSKD